MSTPTPFLPPSQAHESGRRYPENRRCAARLLPWGVRLARQQDRVRDPDRPARQRTGPSGLAQSGPAATEFDRRGVVGEVSRPRPRGIATTPAGEPSSQLGVIKAATSAPCGKPQAVGLAFLPAAEFGPVALAEVRNHAVARGLSRKGRTGPLTLSADSFRGPCQRKRPSHLSSSSG